MFEVYGCVGGGCGLELTFDQNRQQLLSAASYIMNDDPCRMWMYGIRVLLNEKTLCSCLQLGR